MVEKTSTLKLEHSFSRCFVKKIELKIFVKLLFDGSNHVLLGYNGCTYKLLRSKMNTMQIVKKKKMRKLRKKCSY